METFSKVFNDKINILKLNLKTSGIAVKINNGDYRFSSSVEVCGDGPVVPPSIENYNAAKTYFSSIFDFKDYVFVELNIIQFQSAVLGAGLRWQLEFSADKKFFL